MRKIKGEVHIYFAKKQPKQLKKPIRRKKVKAILFNIATNENLYWDNIDEDDRNWYLLGYRTVKYGDVSTVKTLPKVIWELKEKMS